MANAVIYARYSSHNQREESIEGQLRECKSFAERNGYTIISIFADRAISGRTDDRPEFQKMIEASTTHSFEYVIVYSLDRFSRNRFDSAIYKHELKKNGVKVLSAKENITDEPAGILMESVLEGMAEYYSAELAQKIRRGMTENALKARWASGAVPLGYKVNKDRKLEIDPIAAPVIQEIFQRYADGDEIVSISNTLNSRGITTRTGGKWGRNSYWRLLTNRVYIGEFKWRDIIIPDGAPAIIDKDLFEKVQIRVLRQKHKRGIPKSTKDIYLLSGKLICGSCGGYMVGLSGTSKNGRTHRYYVCANHRKHLKKCETKSIPCSKIECFVIDKTLEVLSRPGEIENIATQLTKELQKAPKDKTLQYAKKKLLTISSQLKNITMAIASTGTITPTIKATMEQLEEQKASIEKELAVAKIMAEATTDTKQIVPFLRSFLTGGNAEKILMDLVQYVKLTRKKDGTFSVLIRYNYTPQTPTTPTSGNGGCSFNSTLVALLTKNTNIQLIINRYFWGLQNLYIY